MDELKLEVIHKYICKCYRQIICKMSCVWTCALFRSFHQMLRRVLGPALGDTQVSQLALAPSPQIPSSFSRLPSPHTPKCGYHMGWHQFDTFLEHMYILQTTQYPFPSLQITISKLITTFIDIYLELTICQAML